MEDYFEMGNVLKCEATIINNDAHYQVTVKGNSLYYRIF